MPALVPTHINAYYRDLVDAKQAVAMGGVLPSKEVSAPEAVVEDVISSEDVSAAEKPVKDVKKGQK